MPLTISLVAGTAWPPSTPANDCVLAAFAEVASWVVGTNTVEVQVNWVNTGGNVAGSSIPFSTTSSYASIKSALQNQTALDVLTNNIKSTANATLPGSAPGGAPGSFKTYPLWDAITTNANYLHAFGYNQITLNSAQTFDTSVPVDNSPITGFGMYQAILHEVTELFQRFSLLTSNTGPLDLFGYSAASTRSFSASGRYPSWDDGATSLGSYGSSGDLADWGGTETGAGWQGSSTASPFDASGASGNPQLIRYLDAQVLSLMGIPMTARGLMVCGFPTNTVAPVVTGTPQVGQTLTRAAGTWVGQSSITVVGNWQRNGSNIGGATSSTYVLQSADAGTTVRWQDSASNVMGTNTQTSNEVLIADSAILGIGGKIQMGSAKFTSRPTDMPHA